MVENKGYDWLITLKKFGIAAAFVIVAGLASVYGNNQWYLAIAPILAALENYLKHRKD